GIKGRSHRLAGPVVGPVVCRGFRDTGIASPVDIGEMYSGSQVFMFTLRCTRKLLNNFGVESRDTDVPPTTVLGDWYANLLFTKHRRLVICVSERSLLPVFVEANSKLSFVERFRQSVRSVLERVG